MSLKLSIINTNLCIFYLALIWDTPNRFDRLMMRFVAHRHAFRPPANTRTHTQKRMKLKLGFKWMLNSNMVIYSISSRTEQSHAIHTDWFVLQRMYYCEHHNFNHNNLWSVWPSLLTCCIFRHCPLAVWPSKSNVFWSISFETAPSMPKANGSFGWAGVSVPWKIKSHWVIWAKRARRKNPNGN